jgi:hypothetical protein
MAQKLLGLPWQPVLHGVVLSLPTCGTPKKNNHSPKLGAIMFNKLTFGLIAFLASLSVQAAVLTFTDRATFQAAVSGYTVDDLNDLTDGQELDSNIDRGAYSIHMRSYGCASGPGQCGDNSAQGFEYPAYLWTYSGGSFDFVKPINAFGIDFGAYQHPIAVVFLNGEKYSSANGGFFGILDTSNFFTSVSYSAGGSGSLLDNVTYGTAGPAQVPEPGSMALFVIALAGFGVLRRRAA